MTSVCCKFVTKLAIFSEFGALIAEKYHWRKTISLQSRTNSNSTLQTLSPTLSPETMPLQPLNFKHLRETKEICYTGISIY